MSDLKGSKQFSSVVVPYQPRKRQMIVVAVSVLVVIVGGLSFLAGWRAVEVNYLELREERDGLALDLAEVRDELKGATQSFQNVRLGSEVDRKAVDDIRATVREQKQTIAALNEEIGFYRGLMAPTEREKGLSIRGWELYPGSKPDAYQYKLVLQQLALKHTVLKGSVSVRVIGVQDGVEKSYPLEQLASGQEASVLKLRFKYFQNIEGELQVPAGFEPQRIDVVAKATSPKVAKVEKHYGWVVQGG
jgi:uncharacterized protein DUF6776